MDYGQLQAEVRTLCVEHLGEHVGLQLAALAKPGFALKRVRPGRPVTGRCRFGGRPLLEPGTPWPEFEGIPLSLFAVLDVDEMASWLGDHGPVRSGVLNFFYLEPDPHQGEIWERYRNLSYDLRDSGICRVVPARSDRVEEAPTAPGALAFEQTPLHATPVITLPALNLGWDCDPIVKSIDYGTALGDYPYPAGVWLAERFSSPWSDFCCEQGLTYEDDQGFVCPDQAFGWPAYENSDSLLVELSKEEPYQHLLMLSSNELWSWADGGNLVFVSSGKPLRDGDLTQVVAMPDAW